MGVFPFIDTAAVETVTGELPMFREYAYDFENRTLRLRDGRTYLVEGNEALSIWIFFALAAARCRYAAYDRAYGSQIEELIGQSMEDETVRMELERFITEALMSNPYIEELSEFIFTLKKDGILAEFTCRSIYGPFQVEYMAKGAV